MAAVASPAPSLTSRQQDALVHLMRGRHWRPNAPEAWNRMMDQSHKPRPVTAKPYTAQCKSLAKLGLCTFGVPDQEIPGWGQQAAVATLTPEGLALGLEIMG